MRPPREPWPPRRCPKRTNPRGPRRGQVGSAEKRGKRVVYLTLGVVGKEGPHASAVRARAEPTLVSVIGDALPFQPAVACLATRVRTVDHRASKLLSL
jgi:hypothetical protein